MDYGDVEKDRRNAEVEKEELKFSSCVSYFMFLISSAAPSKNEEKTSMDPFELFIGLHICLLLSHRSTFVFLARR